jgi:hypothetical protein
MEKLDRFVAAAASGSRRTRSPRLDAGDIGLIFVSKIADRSAEARAEIGNASPFAY